MNRHPQLPISVLERIDELCVSFETQWQAGTPLTIESLLEQAGTDAERATLLAELVVLEVDYRQRRGEQPAAREYIARFPENTETVNAVFEEAKQSASAFATPTIEELAPLFPKLEILELVGVGGMGAVYKARQTGLDRLVALKILPKEFAEDTRFALRFTREARTLARLTHPNIVSVFEFGSAQDTFYFLMEFVEGSTLRAVVASGGLDPKSALAIVPHLCDALQFAHDKGVIHRDIKPENILMGIDGSVKIADFGLSRIMDTESQAEALTVTHQIMGTPRYMAPEQFEGSGSVDHRADIFSLGVVIYEMLTGELPLGKFAPPSEKVQIDVRLDEVVLRTLEKEPNRRYQQASHIKTDVQSITDLSVSSVPNAVGVHSHPAGSGVSSSPDVGQSLNSSLEQQELAGRLILTRTQLMERVKQSLKPLSRGQVLQVLIGVLLVVLGASCWAPNVRIPHRLVCGIIVHVYGVFTIAAAIFVMTRINRIDYSKPVDEIRRKLDRVRAGYLRFAPLIGFAWWLMWIPLAVAIGFDAVVIYPGSLWPSLAVGVVGILLTAILLNRPIRAMHRAPEGIQNDLAGSSINNAYKVLQEIESANIR